MNKGIPGPWHVRDDGFVWNDENHPVCYVGKLNPKLQALIAAGPEMYGLICKILDDEELTEGRLKRMRELYARIDGDST